MVPPSQGSCEGSWKQEVVLEGTLLLGATDLASTLKNTQLQNDVLASISAPPPTVQQTQRGRLLISPLVVVELCYLTCAKH